ncbi:MAG: YitT family protein [Acutalibacteraceae bacterium]|nr:YitT family protein [Bacillota bacterium]
MKKIKANLKELSPFNFLVLTLAGIINSIGVTMFLSPVKLYDSGISGTSMLLGQITPEYLSLSLFLILINIPIFIYGYRKQGLMFTIYSIYAVAVYSISAFVITDILPVDVSTVSPFAQDDLFLCAIFGGIVSGIGSGLTIRFGGAIDGIEVLAVIFAKKLSLTVGTFVMIYNIVLYMAVGVILNSWVLPLYSIVTYAAALKTVDFIVEGIDKCKAAVIITTKPQEISRALSETFGSGITLIPAKGYYSDQDKTVIYFVVNRFQISRMKRVVLENDKEAFISITETADAFGSNSKAEKNKI